MARPTLREERDRARGLVRALTARLYDEHGRKCECGKPSEGDCGTMRLLFDADRHLKHWGMADLSADDIIGHFPSDAKAAIAAAVEGKPHRLLDDLRREIMTGSDDLSADVSASEAALRGALERIGWHELTAREARDVARAALTPEETPQ